ncbi:hypothetical protein ALISP_3378 [Alicycliphilus sp. B1]|nr:hypothetical protein ALISP_3378 [Alicycliphilus sp. B1]
MLPPAPLEAKLYFSVFAAWMKSRTLRAVTCGPTTSTLGMDATLVMGAKSLIGVELQVLVQAGVDGVGAGRAHHQGVAVGGRRRRVRGADVAVGAGPVVHDDGLPQRIAQALGHDARQQVGHAAGGEGHHHGDGLDGVVRRRRRLRVYRGGQGEDGGREQGAAMGGVGQGHGCVRDEWMGDVAFRRLWSCN